ncbi:NAD(P)-binding protein [Aspergillus sclerotioniger CBS 115572]|uniref:NAD(P)-binding protein n=1 Tax=Aspergillus sclerotioniger CBS 115572 TaxID=1450535 RepID=A0A317W279_9EURO|nr:NAD(P)-binding protein [Aspergillus sclerotioniger CBS 115572]PWY80736.1 NAD(P)-binding protein [Aspergillus sclerotioniger CBS 115572]
MASREFLLILMPWTPPAEWVSGVIDSIPNIRIEIFQIDRSAAELPAEISLEVWKDVTSLFTWKLFPTKELAPNLRYVQLLSAGCNHANELPLFQEPEVALCTANGVHPPQITEWVFMTFLAFQHHLPQYLKYQKVGKWVDPVSDEDTEDAVGLRVGIMGYGSIGRQCARVAKAFGMDVHAFTMRPRATLASRKADTFSEPGLGDAVGEFPSRWFWGKDQLNGFLSSDLDLLVITVPLTRETRGIISREQFALLSKKKTYVSNIARGAVINTEDLVAALEGGQIRGAALDVTDPEPLPADHKLWGFKNVIITPHCSGNSTHYNERALKILASNLERRAHGKGLINQVDKALGY